MKHLAAVLTLASFLSAGCGSTPVDPTPAAETADAGRLSASALAADLETLHEVVFALHPGLERFRARADVEAAFLRLRDAVAQGATTGEFFWALSVFAAELRCGHTHPNPFNQSEAVQQALFDAPSLPFLFRWIDGQLVVTDDLTDPASAPPLPVGTRVVSLDGVSSRAVLAALMPVGRADGSNDGKRVASLELRGLDRFEAFDAYWNLRYPARAPTVSLGIVTPDGKPAAITRPRLRPSERLARLAARHAAPAAPAESASVPVGDAPPEPEPLWRLELRQGVGWLRMPNWVTYHSKWDWRAALQRDMEALVAAGSKALVVDLRGNEGGTGVGDRLVRYLLAAPVAAGQPLRLVRYQAVPPSLRPVLDTWDETFYDWGRLAHELGDGWYTQRFEDEGTGDDDGPGADGMLTPLAPHFAGKVYVLVDAMNSSATFEFATAIQQHRLGLLVGEPTGGNMRGINGGAFFFLRLPRSGLSLDLPIISQSLLGAESPRPRDAAAALAAIAALPDQGLTPDRLVPTTAADIAAGRDAAVELVRRELGLTAE